MGAGAETFTLRYRSERGEIWRWYWRQWRAGGWRRWFGLALAGGAIAFVAAWQQHPNQRPGSIDVAIGLLVFLGALVFFTVYPQASFKPQDRELRIGPQGIDTAIGTLNATRPWREIGEIEDEGICIALTVTGNAFLVPNRAFENAAQRGEFLARATAWRDAAPAA